MGRRVYAESAFEGGPDEPHIGETVRRERKRRAVEAAVQARARSARRRVLRRFGLRASELDPVASGYLSAWSRGSARLSMIESGEVDEPYWPAFNATARQWRAFEKRLREVGVVQDAKGAPGAALAAWVESRNGGAE